MRTQAAAWLDALFKTDELRHEYDPVKAHEYYLRTRELKGRQPGQSQEPESVRVANQAAERERQVEAERQKRREALKARLEELEVRLEQLKAAVKRARLAAMRRAGVSEETLNRMISQEVKSPGSTKGGTSLPEGKEDKSSKDGSSDSDDSDRKPKTAEQKRKDAKAAKERYEEEKAKNPDPDEQLAALQEKVDEANQRIEKMQKRVEAIKRIGSDDDKAR